MKRVLGLVMLAATFLTLGCAETAEERKVDEMVKNEAPAREQGSLATRGANLFVNSPNLTAEQKEQLLKVHGETYQKVAKIRDEITQAKTVLFKSLTTPTTSKKEINALKNKIVSLDKQRLDVMMKAFDNVQKIVGTNQNLDDETIKHFMDMETIKQ